MNGCRTSAAAPRPIRGDPRPARRKNVDALADACRDLLFKEYAGDSASPAAEQILPRRGASPWINIAMLDFVWAAKPAAIGLRGAGLQKQRRTDRRDRRGVQTRCCHQHYAVEVSCASLNYQVAALAMTDVSAPLQQSGLTGQRHRPGQPDSSRVSGSTMATDGMTAKKPHDRLQLSRQPLSGRLFDQGLTLELVKISPGGRRFDQ